MPRAALYTRVSSLGQARDGYSLGYQREILHAFCEREGLAIHRVYEDGGRSGSTTEREGLQALIADARQGSFDVVLIFRVDRFSRDPLDLLALVQELNRRSIRLRSVTEAVDANDPAGELMLTILGAIGKFVRQNIIQNAMLGKRKRAETGRYTGGRVPFGFIVADAGTLEPDSSTWWRDRTAADVARMVFELYEELFHQGGGGAAAVADRLIALDVPAPQTRWNAASIVQMLRNPAYAGDAAYNKRSHNLHKASQVNDPKEWILVPGAHRAIVPRPLWDRVQALRRQNRRGGRRSQPDTPHLLAGCVRCAACGCALTPRRAGGGGRLYYTCASRYNHARRRDGTHCADFPFLRMEALDALVWGLVVRLATHADTVEGLLARRRGENLPRLRQAEKDLERLARRRDGCGVQEHRLTTAFAEGKLPEELWLKQMSRLREEREQLAVCEQAARQTAADLLRQPALVWDAAALRDYLTRLLTGREMGVAEKRQALALLIGEKGIQVRKTGEVDIDLRLPLPLEDDGPERTAGGDPVRPGLVRPRGGDAGVPPSGPPEGVDAPRSRVVPEGCAPQAAKRPVPPRPGR